MAIRFMHASSGHFRQLDSRNSLFVVRNAMVWIFLVFGLSACAQTEQNQTTMPDYNQLTPQEEYILIHKGTERPFTGKYYDFWDEGTYVCRRCNTPLYTSAAKFDAGCGWPSFDDEIPGAVSKQIDADGLRTEILCANCGGHLGHVFQGEGFTPKNTRHCVNSLSMDFVSSAELTKPQTDTAVFASGCFWGVEYHFKRQKGVLSTKVGYTGGQTPRPSYQEVCTGTTGHAEAIEVVYDTRLVDYETLARLFFETHDPTQRNRQGPDVGSQYRSAVFYRSEAQKETIQKLIRLLEAKGLNVVTELSPVSEFWEAEDYHQDYYGKTQGRPYCHIYTRRF